MAANPIRDLLDRKKIKRTCTKLQREQKRNKTVEVKGLGTTRDLRRERKFPKTFQKGVCRKRGLSLHSQPPVCVQTLKHITVLCSIFRCAAVLLIIFPENVRMIPKVFPYLYILRIAAFHPISLVILLIFDPGSIVFHFFPETTCKKMRIRILLQDP